MSWVVRVMWYRIERNFEFTYNFFKAPQADFFFVNQWLIQENAVFSILLCSPNKFTALFPVLKHHFFSLKAPLFRLPQSGTYSSAWKHHFSKVVLSVWKYHFFEIFACAPLPLAAHPKKGMVASVERVGYPRNVCFGVLDPDAQFSMGR